MKKTPSLKCFPPHLSIFEPFEPHICPFQHGLFLFGLFWACFLFFAPTLTFFSFQLDYCTCIYPNGKEPQIEKNPLPMS